MGTCGFCQPDQGLSYGQYPIPISPSIPGQASFVVPPPLDRASQHAHTAFSGAPAASIQTSQFGGQIAPGPLGPGVGTNSGLYGQANPMLSSGPGQQRPFYGQPPLNTSFGAVGGPQQGFGGFAGRPGGPQPGFAR
jgi:hypothetical protein